MHLTYAKKDFLNFGNQEYIDGIKATEAICEPFDLCCQALGGRWGICLHWGDRSFWVNDPCELVSSLLSDESMIFIHEHAGGTEDEAKGAKPRALLVDVRKQTYCMEWEYHIPTEAAITIRRFTFAEYIAKIKTAIQQLQNIILAHNPEVNCVYGEALTADVLTNCLRQLDIDAILPSYFKTKTDIVRVEAFDFYLAKEDEFHEKYHIGIGNRGFDTYLTHWDSDYDRIRHQLENYVYEREATLRLSFDTSDTILKISRKSILDKETPVGPGYAFSYKDLALIEIQPNDFCAQLTVKGYCNEKQFLSMLYEGLLAMALTHPYDGDDDYDESPLLKAYNQLKSPLIENYISGLKEAERSDRTGHRRDLVAMDTGIARRQQIIKTIIQIDPDYDVCFRFLSEDRAPLSIDNDRIDDLLDINGESIVIPGYSAWLQELEPVIIASAMGKKYAFDWKTYHQRGIALACQLRAQLPSDIDLWYAAPFEDNSQQIPRPILIRKTYAPLCL